MSSNTLNIDITDRSVSPDNRVNIAIINQPNPVSNYTATAKQIQQLIQIPKYFIYEAGTNKPVTGSNFYTYFPDLSPGGGATQSEIEELNARIDELTERVNQIDVSKLSVTEYTQGEDIPRGRIVYVTPGQLYQATVDFTSDNTSGKTVQESMTIDINSGKLSAVTDSEIGDLGDRVNVLEEWRETVDQDIGYLKEAVISAEEVEFYNTYSEFPNIGSDGIIYVDNSTGKSYTWDGSGYDLMNTNNIIPGSIIQSTI